MTVVPSMLLLRHKRKDMSWDVLQYYVPRDTRFRLANPCKKRYITIVLILVIVILVHLLFGDSYSILRPSEKYIQHKFKEWGLKKDYVLMRFQSNTTKLDYPPEDFEFWKKCDNRKYDLDSLPQASIIIVFCENEQLEDLLHTIHSIVYYSPAKLLKEIILVDDNTQKESFKTLLLQYMKTLFGGLVKILHSTKSLGLIQGRLLGIRHASAPVVIVQDAHIEVMPKWLEPVLFEISKNRRILASMGVEAMRPKDNGTWEMQFYRVHRTTAFFWRLGFRSFQFDSAEERKRLARDPTLPIKSAASIGTWAMDKRFFEQIGELDEGMEFWGGENLDLSIRVYLWGGTVYNIPCSHIAHLEKPGQRDYRRGKNHTLQMLTNMKRMAETWLGDTSDTFYHFNPDLKDIDPGDLTERFELRKHCPGSCSFAKDYLARAYPQLGLPFQNSIAHGGLKNVGVPGHSVYSMEPWKFGLRVTRNFAAHEEIYLTTEGHLRATLNSFDISVDEKGINKIVFNFYFNETVQRTKWLHKKGGTLQAMGTKLCLHGIAAKDRSLSVAACDSNEANQLWMFGVYTSIYDSMATKEGLTHESDYLRQMKDFVR